MPALGSMPAYSRGVLRTPTSFLLPSRNANLVAHAHLERRNVDLAAIHFDVAVANDLAGLTARNGEAETESHVVKTALKLLDQQLAGDALRAAGLLVIRAELALKREVDALGLLLFAQLQAVAYDLGLAVAAVLAGREVALLDRATCPKSIWCPSEKAWCLRDGKGGRLLRYNVPLNSPSFGGRPVYVDAADFVPAQISCQFQLCQSRQLIR